MFKYLCYEMQQGKWTVANSSLSTADFSPGNSCGMPGEYNQKVKKKKKKKKKNNKLLAATTN